MDLWLWMGLRGSMKPSSRERLSQNIKLLRIYRFLSERYISFVIRIWLLKIYLGWSVFFVAGIQFVFRLRERNDTESDGWGQSTGSPSVSRCQLRSGLSLVNGQQPRPLIGSGTGYQGLPLVLAMHNNCRTPDMFKLFFTPDVLITLMI